MYISKYKLFLVVLGILVSFFFGSQLYKLLFWERAEGRVTGFRTERGLRSTYTYPTVYFETKDYEVRFSAPAFTSDLLRKGRRVNVVYNPKDPSDAYVNTFYGMWAFGLMYFVPLMLICIAATFGADSLPKRVKVW